MSERDSDIEFDFFDEGETREATGVERPRRRGPRPPVRPPAGLTPLLRLIGLISFAILIVVLLVFWVNSCREDQRKDSYRNYMEDVGTLASRSQALGTDLNGVLTARGKKQDELEQELEGLAQQQEQLENQADEVKNSGCAQEVGIAVTLTIQKSPSPIVKRSRIDLINPGETKTVNFTDIGTPPFGERTSLSIEVAPVQNEATTNNNTSEYPVVFSLG
jgi:hypothetical protein